jgi:hypothetical protein
LSTQCVHTFAVHSLWISYLKEMLLGRGHCSGSANTFIPLCLHMLIYVSLDVWRWVEVPCSG